MKQPYSLLTSILLLLGVASAAQAQAPLTPKAQFAADSKVAMARYTNDKTLCNDEATSNARLQCRRDAKAEYDKAIAAAKAQMKVATSPAKAHETKAVCADCGKVTAVSQNERAGEGGPVGILAGGAAGAVLGNQVGGGIGKDLATIAGAVGGAYAGKKIEEQVRARKVWTVSVHYVNGSSANFDFEQDPGLKVGDAVKNSGNSIVRN
jgi:outer membrane lipoprotein SlyB